MSSSKGSKGDTLTKSSGDRTKESKDKSDKRSKTDKKSDKSGKNEQKQKAILSDFLRKANLDQDSIDYVLDINDSHIKYYVNRDDSEDTKEYLTDDDEIEQYKPVYRKIYELDTPDMLFKVIGTFINIPEGVSMDDVVDYYSGIPINTGDLGQTIGKHIITERNITYKYLRCYVMKQDVGKQIGTRIVKKRDVGLTIMGFIPNIRDIGKTLGGITIKRSDVTLPWEGVRIHEDDIGKVVNRSTITSKQVGKKLELDLVPSDIGMTLGGREITDVSENTFTIKKEDVGKLYGGIVIRNVMVGKSMGGVNFYQSGYDNPIYVKNQIAYDILIETIRNEVEGSEGVIVCNKCGSNETVAFTEQTRSADEPPDVVWQCCKCRHHGRIRG